MANKGQQLNLDKTYKIGELSLIPLHTRGAKFLHYSSSEIKISEESKDLKCNFFEINKLISKEVYYFKRNNTSYTLNLSKTPSQ